MSLVITVFSEDIKGILKELENMSEKGDLCEKIVAEMLQTTFMDSETIIWKYCQGASKVIEQVYDKSNFVQRANKLLAGP